MARPRVVVIIGGGGGGVVAERHRVAHSMGFSAGQRISPAMTR